MSETSPPPTLPPVFPKAVIIKKSRQLSPIWIIPIVAACLGLWLVWQHFSAKGPLVEVQFETAEGIVSGKTSIMCRSVGVGIVETVRLDANMKGVITTIRIDHAAANVLKSDTRFWVVRPRFGGTGISGLSTIVSGTYIELDPGLSKQTARKFIGLENPPVTPQGVPGLHITLVADEGGSLGPGSSISYKGIKVGKIESRVFNTQKSRVEYGAFIEGTFGNLVSERSRFWNVSGIDLDVSAAGVRLRTGTLESLVAGGVAFDSAEIDIHAKQAGDGFIFPLYKSHDDTEDTSLNPRLTYLLLFKDSVRGLSKEAPVEFRGIRIGTVEDISFDFLPNDPEHRVPVLIKLDASVLGNLPKDDLSAGPGVIAQSVRTGLRATLKTGSLLTGQLFVDLDFQKEGPSAEVVMVEGYRTIPTISSGLGQLQDKVTALLDKFQALPLNETVTNANTALAEIKDMAVVAKGTVAELNGAAANLDKLLASKETQALPAELKSSLTSLRKTLDGFNQNSSVYRDLATTIQELSSALRAIDSLATTIERKPSSLLWGNPKGNVSPPRAKP
ncbi:MAG: Mammalian cell entry related domain protein [Chthoniobacteraceae bacterium]|nr:Mammalian cell entry related domain protein [Chthoniobacteraceae bacterium]